MYVWIIHFYTIVLLMLKALAQSLFIHPSFSFCVPFLSLGQNVHHALEKRYLPHEHSLDALMHYTHEKIIGEI